MQVFCREEEIIRRQSLPAPGPFPIFFSGAKKIFGRQQRLVPAGTVIGGRWGYRPRQTHCYLISPRYRHVALGKSFLAIEMEE